MDVGQPTLDQLRIFLAVAEDGSFNRAAKRLGRAISVISYGVANLEAQLGVTLFHREGSRRPTLTAEGAALLAEARAVADDVDGLVAKVRGLHQGLEAEISLVVDVMVPGGVIATILRDFQAAFPTVTLRLAIEALGAVAALVEDLGADLGIGGPVMADCAEIRRQTIGAVQLVPVASPHHPLARPGGQPPGAARKHLQLVLTDRSRLTEGRDFSVLSPRTWRLGDLGAKHALLREGIGWGNMPRHAVAEDLANGTLVTLDLADAPAVDYTLTAIWLKDRPLGPAARWLLSAFDLAL